jgi:hypothetical protein
MKGLRIKPLRNLLVHKIRERTLAFPAQRCGPETIDILRRNYGKLFNLLRKEVIHRQLPLPMPCYDFTPVMGLTFKLPCGRSSGTTHFHGVTGGVYKIRERIHRGEADPRLLAIPAS